MFYVLVERCLLTFAISHPADMTEQNWNVVMRTNKILTGQRLVSSTIEKKIGDKVTTKHLVAVERGTLTGMHSKIRTRISALQISTTCSVVQLLTGL